MASQITATLPTLDFPREVDYPTQEDWAVFSAAAEENFGILGGDWSTQMQLWKTEANAMSTELNTNATIAQGLANYQGDWISKGYTLGQTVSVSGIYYICKLTHATGQNPTASGSTYWNLAIGNWNLKVNNYGDESITGIKNFTSSPTVPTPLTTGNVITMDNIIQKTPVGIGYGNGAGIVVAQLTNKNTTVTANKPTGRIIMSNSALAPGNSGEFLVNNSLLTMDDIVVVNILSIMGTTPNSYRLDVRESVLGFFVIRLTNISGGSLSENINVKFNILKGASA